MYMYRGMFGASDFKRLVAHVDGFSLMTYDYSQPGRYNVICFCYVMFSVYNICVHLIDNNYYYEHMY